MMSDDEKLNNRLRMQKEIEKTIIDKIERPAREAIDALLAEAAERRAEADQKRREIETHLEQTERRLDLIFIISISMAGLMAIAGFVAFIKYLFW